MGGGGGGVKLVPKRGVAYLVGMQSQISCSEYNQIFKVFFSHGDCKISNFLFVHTAL